MGYTHYWCRKEDLSDGWEEFINDVKKVYENFLKVELKIAGGFGVGEPVFDENMVWFNGEGELAEQTFYLPRIILENGKKGYLVLEKVFCFTFCNTDRKPYDILVTAVLILAKRHFDKKIKIASDGNWRDWKEARELIERTLGYRGLKSIFSKLI